MFVNLRISRRSFIPRFPIAKRRASSGPNGLRIERVLGALAKVLKRLMCGAQHSLPSNVEFQNSLIR